MIIKEPYAGKPHSAFDVAEAGNMVFLDACVTFFIY